MTNPIEPHNNRHTPTRNDNAIEDARGARASEVRERQGDEALAAAPDALAPGSEPETQKLEIIPEALESTIAFIKNARSLEELKSPGEKGEVETEILQDPYGDIQEALVPYAKAFDEYVLGKPNE